MAKKKGDGSDGYDGSDGSYGVCEKRKEKNKKIVNQHFSGTPTKPSLPSEPPQPSLISFLFDGFEKKELHPAVGTFIKENYLHYYFGLMLPSKVLKKPKEGNPYYSYGNNLAIIDSDNQILSEKELKDMGYEVDDGIYQKELRWELGMIEGYKDLIEWGIEPSAIFDEILEKYKNYIEFINEEEAYLLSLWDMGTYFFTLFSTYPYIHLHGLKNTGKTKVMELSSSITFNAQISVGMTVPTLFRIIQKNKPTLYIDEFEIKDDQKKSNDDKEFEGMLNAGYRKGMTVPRMEQKEKDWIVKNFEVYCPKMIANISGLRGALATRCIKIVMQRSRVEGFQGRLEINPESDEWKEIRNHLYILALKKWMDVKNIYDNLEDKSNISNRDWQLWKPVLVMAKFVSEEIYCKMLVFAERRSEQMAMEDEMDNSWEYLLLKILMEVVDEERYYYVKSEIFARLEEEFIEREYTDAQGNIQFIYKKSKPSPEWIGRTLRKLGVINYKKDNKGSQYMLSKNKIMDMVSRLQIKSLMENKKENESQSSIAQRGSAG